MSNVTNKYALLSVYDKTNIASIADALIRTGYIIIATAGTGEVLKKAGISYILASTMTGNPDALTDCLQTLSFKFAGGIIYNRHNKKHQIEVKNENIPRIDVVICNLTNISETVKTIDDFNIQHVDLGGPTMVRAACINYKDVLVVTDPNDYQLVSDILLEGKNTNDFRKQMAIKGFRNTSSYDEILVQYLTDSLGI